METINKLIQKIRFTKDTRFYTWLKAHVHIDTVREKVISETFDILDQKEFLNSSILVNEAIAPKIHELVLESKKKLSLKNIHIDAYIKADNHLNAAIAKQTSNRYLVYLTSPLIEKMTDNELLFVIGHEFGHAIYQHEDLPIRGIISEIEDPDYEVTEHLLRWSRMAEISADRVGLFCCGDLKSAVNALLVLTVGLSSNFLSVDTDLYGDEVTDLIKRLSERGQTEDLYSTHPFNPLRVAALNLFWQAKELHDLSGIGGNSIPLQTINKKLKVLLEQMEGDLSIQETEDEISFSKNKKKVLAEGDVASAMLLWGCLCVASSDGDIHDKEINSICRWLRQADVAVEIAHLKLADDPFEYSKARITELSHSLSKVVQAERCAMLQKFTIIARADGKVLDCERDALTFLCKALDISENFYLKIMKYL